MLLRLVFIAGVITAGIYLAPHFDGLDDRRLAWAALLPLVYIVGMVVVLKD